MSTIHDRWELVEPLLFAHTLRDPAAFHTGATTSTRNKDFEALGREHRFEPAAVARAFDALGEDAPSTLDGPLPVHVIIRTAANRWLVPRVTTGRSALTLDARATR